MVLRAGEGETGHGGAEDGPPLLLSRAGRLGPRVLGRGQLQRDPAIGRECITAAERHGGARKANEGCGCRHGCVWQMRERGVCSSEGFWSGRCCGKTPGGDGLRGSERLKV